MYKGKKLLMLLLVFIALISAGHSIQSNLLIPIETTKGVKTEYSIGFLPETIVPSSAKINVIFPFEFDPRALINYGSCSLQRASGNLLTVPCTITNRTFTLTVGTIALENMIVVISNILNPIDSQMSSHFIVQTLFKKVIVQQNIDFGKTLFTSSPIDGGLTMVVNNFQNTLVQMGSSWVFQFTLSKSYPQNSTIRFIFPEGFSTLKIQCNISGVIDPSQQTRVFPNGRAYDCLNIKSTLIPAQRIILSGVVNPKYQMSVNTIQAHILQPNNLVVLEKVKMIAAPAITISRKTMNATVTIPNKFRNNTLTYIFQINMDSDLLVGDYMQIQFTGNWTFFLNDSVFLQGINSDALRTPVFQSSYSWPTSSNIFIRNFSSILRSSQISFYISLRTPLTANTYTLTLSAFRSNGGLVERYTQPVIINATSGYIRQMRLHPMVQTIKLPVGQTGPLQFTLGLRQNLPQTNVLTYGKIVVQIIPNLPLPNVNKNGVPKCYFYGDIEAKNCTYDASNPSYTNIIAFTPINFNFQSSQIPFMVTTEGYISPQYEGITIDTLVKRYHFHVQFYTDYRPQPIPTQVIFGDWVADSIPLSTFSCNTMNSATRQWDHLFCTVITPNQDLCQPDYFHFFRIQFTGSNPPWYGWNNQLGYTSNHIHPDYPCIVYGVNLTAVPYIKCDLVTWQTGPYASTLAKSYINIYGFDLLPGGSTITIQIPRIQRHTTSYDTKLQFSILQDTWGYQTDYITLYSQSISVTSTYYIDSSYDGYTAETPSITLSNSIINKVTSITLNNYNLGQSGVTHIVFQVDQTLFQDIGRGNNISCGVHSCSKFNKPIQYFILYPSRAMALVQNLTFPSIVTPVYADSYQLRLRIYKSNSYVKHVSFNVVITPETMNTPTFTFSPLQSIATIFPKTYHYYLVSFTTKNPLPAATSYITVTFNNYFTLSSDYCVVTTTAPANDTREIECQPWENSNIVYIQNLGAVPSNTNFSLTVQMITTSSANPVIPTVSIITYYTTNKIVDQVLNAGFTNTPSLTNTNLPTMTTFTIPNPQTIERSPTLGYFGNLLLNFRPVVSNSITIGYYLKLTFTNQFYPYSNQLNLPLNCKINNVRLPCTYTLAPFVVTISQITNKINLGSNNIINITTDYLDLNGIYYPATQGRYLIQAQINNNTNTQTYQNVQQYIDILPPTVPYFNVTYAHRDAGLPNIFQICFRTGVTAVPAFNDPTTAGRIYIGFPTKDDSNSDVFTTNLGFNTGIGTVVPCWFQTGSGFISANSGTNLTCKLRDSPYTPKFVFIQVINFNALPANTNVKIILAKITNPALQKFDVNFILRINQMTFSTKQEYPLYQNYYNMFFNMLTASVTNRNQVNSASTMFQPGSKIGDYGKFININPYTGNGNFSTNDWFIVQMNSQFALNGQYGGCLAIFYLNCIVFRQINWFAIKIGNTTILPLQAYVLRLPTSISRVDTTYKCYTYLSTRYAESITYTITANYRWMELRGSIINFNFQVLGSQDKLNIGQKNVDVMVSFTTNHITYAGGSIQIKFPMNTLTVPVIRPHCRSAVTLGSQLQGYPTGKPSTNIEGDLGCIVQNTYSWVITSFETLPANSQINIVGSIDLPTVQTATLGMGYIVTYINTDNTNVTANGRIIDYLYTNFPLQVNNKTWNLDQRPTLYRSDALRINHVGQLKFKLNLASILYGIDNGGGYIDISLWRTTILTNSGGFNGPTSNLVCKILGISLKQRFGCKVINVYTYSTYYTYRIQSIQALSASTNYQFTLTTQNGAGTEGINFPTIQGVYKVQIIAKYSSGNTQQVSQPHYIEVYGPDFRVSNFISTISIPNTFNMILVDLIPPQTIGASTQQIVIQIPTSTVDGQPLFSADLGMGYNDYDNLIFDLYESSVTSMTCKVFTGDNQNHQPVKIVCSNFSPTPTTSMNIKFGFWVKNPATTIGLAIPVFVYAFAPNTGIKNAWSMIQAAINIIPTTTTPVADLGNFVSLPASSATRQISGTNFQFTTRNTRIMAQNDLYILKFNFDLRMSQKYSGNFKYNGFGGIGDVIFMRNCQTVMLRVGSTSLGLTTSGSTTTNARIQSVFYNPSIQLQTSQNTITGYVAYISSNQGQIINHNDVFPSLSPRQMSNPSFTMTAVHGNLNKGVRQDYTFSFTYSTSSSATDMALVKYISIQFPSFATYDLTFANSKCIEHPSSVIQIKSCWIDTNTYTIWIQPVIKASYINSNNFMIETQGLSIINPISTTYVYIRQFVIRYYTWTSNTMPVLYANSDDYVFFKQDSTYISNSYITYVTSFIDKHTYLQLPQQPYINQFEPGSGDIGTNRMKTPFSFVIKAMVAFSNLTSNYHEVRLTYNSFYSIPTLNQQVSSTDLYIYVPTCHLNGFRLHYCTITGGQIITRFQMGFSLGQQMAFRFSIVNPQNQQDDGFYMTTLSNPTVTLPLFFFPYGGSNYYAEAEPFHTFQRASGVYPQLGIYSATLTSFGTQVYGQINYLEFSLSFSRNDLNGLVLQIPVVSPDNTIIYNNPTLLGLSSGSEYPCSVGIGSNVYCYYETGSNTNFGRPTRIFITNFGSVTSLSLRILFTNPDVVGVFPNFIFKAFGGTISAPNLMGSELMGRFQIIDPFKTFPQVGYYSTASCYLYPDRNLYSRNTQLDFKIQVSQSTNTYVILQWILTSATYGDLSQYTLLSSVIIDYFIINYSSTDRRLYLVKKLGSSYAGNSGDYHRFGYIRQKHFMLNSYNLFLLRKPSFTLVSASVDSSWFTTSRITDYYGQPYIQYLDIQNKIVGTTSWHYISVSLGSLHQSTTLFDSTTDQHSGMVLAIRFTSNRPFSSFYSTTHCHIQSGVNNYNKLVPITCRLDTTNNQIVIQNIGVITAQFVKVYYYATTINSQQDNTQVQVRLYANLQSYVATGGGWCIYSGTTPNYDILDMYYSYNTNSVDQLSQPGLPGYTARLYSSIWADTSGYSQILSVSSNSIVVRLYKGNNMGLQNVYQITFRFYVQRLSFSSCNDVSFTSNRYSANFRSQASCGATNKHFWVTYSYRTSSYFEWPYWYAGDYYDFTFSFSSISGDTSTANQLYISTTFTWRTSIYYHSNNAQCGCYNPYQVCCNCCDCWGCYPCQYYYSCYHFYGWSTHLLTGGSNVQAYFPANYLADSYTVDLLSRQRSVQTQLYLSVNNMRRNVGPSYGSFLLFQLGDGQSYSGNNPIPSTRNSDLASYIDCKCVVGSISVSAGTTYQNPTCIRYIMSGYNPSFSVYIDVSQGQSLACFIPGHVTSSSYHPNYIRLHMYLNYFNYFSRNAPHYSWSYGWYPYWSDWFNFGAYQYYIDSGYQGGLNSVSQNSFWSSSSVSAYRSYDLNITSPHWVGSPFVYMSGNAPQPTQGMCSSGFNYCRAYTSFINRRYYLVAQRSGATYTIRFTDNAYYPPSVDYASSYYTWNIYYGEPSQIRYYHYWSSSHGTGGIYPAQPSNSLSPLIYGSTLSGYPSSFIVSVNLNGRTLYSNKRNYGQYQGSFIRLSISGFTSLFGCGATLSNRLSSITAPFYCQLKTSNTLQIRTRQDIIITGTLYITLFTTTMPNSATYTFQLFDKYISGSDYARSVAVSGSFGRVASGYIVVQPTSIMWRRQVYKQFQSSTAPIRFTMNNNYQYVYDYVTTSNSDAIGVVYPGGISNSNSFVCFVKQYPYQQKYLYRSYEAPCSYYTTDTIRITSIPSHIISPNFYYQFSIYINNNGVSMSLALNTNNYFYARIHSLYDLSSYSPFNQDFLLVNRYQSVYPITLSSIYILTAQASATNSLYLSFVVNAVGAAYQTMQFTFNNLGLSSFQIQNGDIIPCYLQAGQFSTISGKTISPLCRGFANGINNDSPLIIRVQKFATMSTGTNWRLAFDGFSNPAVQTLYMLPINCRITFLDNTNLKVYTSYFPSLYASNSINRGVPTPLSGQLAAASTNRGIATYHYFTTTWPYLSNYNDISQKVTMKIQGGITCCNAFTNFALTDSSTGSNYNQLWFNKVINMSVYRTPTFSSYPSVNIRINNVVNPYPIQKQTYQQIKKIQISFYSGYQNTYIKQLDQLSYTSFAQLSQFTVSTNFGTPTDPPTSSYSYHQNYPMTYDISYSSALSSFANRFLDYTILKFTAGVRSIEKAYIKYSVSTGIVNPVLQVKILKDFSGYWCLKITGMNDNIYSSSYNWIVRMRFYPNGATLSYASTTYAQNGQIQFSNSNTQSLSTDGYSGSPIAPNTFELFEKSYIYSHFQLQRKINYATSGLTSKKIQFRFTTPYAISSVQSFNINLPVQTVLIPQNTPNSITCIIQKTVLSYTTFGIGLYAPCSYAAGVYTVNAPVGGLSINQQYTITITQRNQTTTTFTMPSTPARYQVSFIYNSMLSLKFGDTYKFDFSGLMTSFSVNHLILKQSTSNFIGFTFNPRFSLPASSLTAPITESVLQIQFENRNSYFPDCLGIDSLFAGDSMTFQTGTYFTHFSSPAVTNANTRIMCGQYSSSYAQPKLRVTDYGQFTAGTTYYFRFPMITNPSTYNIPFIYTIKLLSYANSIYYPTILGYYEYNGLESTVVGNSYQIIYVYTSVTSGFVQNNLALSFTYNSYNIPNGAQIAYKFKNSDLGALASLASLTSITNSNFAYEYYPNINLCMFRKTNSNAHYTISLGSFPTTSSASTFTTAFIHAYHDVNNIYYGNFNPNTQFTNTISHVTSWSSSSITKVSGLTNSNSQGIYTFSFSSSLTFPEGSYMIMTLDSEFFMFDDYCYQMSGFVQGNTLSTSNLICRKNAAQDILIAGYSTISSGTSLSITLYLQIIASTLTTYNPRARIIVYNSNVAKIIDGYTNTYSLAVSSYGPSTFGLMNYMEQTIKPNSAQEFDFTFTLSTTTLGTGSYIIVDFGNWTIDAATIQGRVIWKYKVGSNIYWVPSQATLVSGNSYKIPVYLNYSMPTNQLISVKVFHQLPDTSMGVYFPRQQFNYLTIKSYNAANTLLQHQYVRTWLEPYQHTTLTVTPILKYVSATTLYEFAFTPNVSVAAGDIISVQFTTSDGYQSSLFSQTLGRTMYTNNSFEMSCQQTNAAGVITPTANPLSCELFKGIATASPPIPTVVQIKTRNAISANTAIRFNILNILNPSVASYQIGITVKLLQICDNTDLNNLCTYYKTTRYITFNTLGTSIPSIASSYGSLTFSPNRVSATNTQHTFTGAYTVNTGDYLRIVYYPQVIIPAICTLSSSNGICYSYPLQNTIVIVASTTQTGSYTFTLSGMTNLYQSRVTQLPDIQIWDASTGLIRARHQPNYWVNHIQTDSATNNPLTMTFNPTLTPDYQLKYGFNNIARIQMTYLLQNNKINMIYITAPSEITISPSYCNATMQSTTAQAKPYPYRFECIQVSSNSVKILKQDNFPTWTSAFINKKVILYLKYQIADSRTVASNSWNVATYTITSTPDTWYRVSQGTGYFNITEFLSPFIYAINFRTQAFSKRTCRTNQLCMFYGYLLPSTTLAQIPISYMTYTLPPQFGYSNLTTYTACKMTEKNDDFNPITCTTTRKDSDVTMKFAPTSYNHNYKLVTIDTSDQTKLFKAPAYPGTHYQMKVNLFSSSNILVESMYVNLTTVYGQLLNYTYMSVRIPKDADSLGLFQFRFKVGAEDILPGYQNSATNRITSKIQLQFSKSFAYDLGTGKDSGDEVSCLAISGLTLSTTGKLTCKIYPSYSTITYCTIAVSGYDRVLAYTDVVIRIAGLKTLAIGVQDYIKMGVSLTYWDYGQVKGYVYQPTGIVVGNTTAAITPATITLGLSESSSNFVGQLVNYAFTGSLGSGFSSIGTSDYIAVEFGSNVFEGTFSLNPKALCTLAASNRCLSFGLSSIIYFSPASPISSSTLNFNLNKIINTAYSFEYINTTFRVFTLVNDKVNAVGTTSIIKFSKPSTNVSAIITKTDSLYGGDSGINYYFQLKLNSNLPKNGLISVQFPNIFQSLFDLNSTCELASTFPWGTYCQIVNSNTLVIRPNGNLLNPNTPYQFTVTNITNPNMKLTNYSFVIVTQFNDNIYSRFIISRNTFACPQINVITVKQCTTFQVTLGANNAFFETLYSISLICPSYIKQASQVNLYLSWNPDPAQQICQSDTNSLYSYQCEITPEYQLTKKYTFLSLYLKQISPQKLISLKGKLKNGQIGTYSLIANISYKGFTYLSTKSNSFFINSNVIRDLSNTQMTLRNYPINRGQNAIYTIRMPKPQYSTSTSTITDILIQVPTEIDISTGTFTCAMLSQTFVQNYFSLILNKLTDLIDCSVSKNFVRLSNVTRLISTLGNDDFLRFSFYRMKNSNTSTTKSTFNISFVDSSTGNGNILASGSVNFPFSISPPPINLQINKIITVSTKLLVRNLYTFNLTTVTGQITINNLTRLGLIIDFPSQYMLIWNRIQTMPTVTITFTDSNNIAVTYNQVALGVNGTLVVSFNTTSAFNFTQAIITFIFVNPSRAIDCSLTPVFNFGLIDFSKNSFIAQTLANNVQCPTFTDKLYQVNISGNYYMQAGKVYNYIISIERPAQFLKITPTIQTSAISFQPNSITFSNFSETVKTFQIKVSTGLTGIFNLSFIKEQGNQIFYNDIPSLNLTTKAVQRNYTVSFVQVDVKSIGLPIEIKANLQVQNSKQFTLVFTHNCSSSFTFNPTSFINLAPATKQTLITITYSGTTVPSMCAINFGISSATSNNYVLDKRMLYVSATTSIEKSSTVPIMRLRIGPSYRQSSNVGTTIANKDISISTLKPVVYNIKQISASSNSGNFLISVSEPGTIYFAALKIGTNRNNVLQTEIYSQSVDTGISYGSAKTNISSNIVSIQANFIIEGLATQTSYLIGAYLNSSIGVSNISFIVFKTKKSSNGASINIAFSAIETNASIINAISLTIRVLPSRINILTMSSILTTQQNAFNTAVMNTRQYVYEVVIGPNTQDDSVSPLEKFQSFINSQDQRKKFGTFLPSFINTYRMSAKQIILAIPKFRSGQELAIKAATHQKVKLAVNIWDKSIAYAVIVPTPTENLLSAQIASGLDQDNKNVPIQHFQSSLTSVDGYIEFQFTLLQSDTNYKVFVTAQCVVPYQPRQRVPDSQVISIQVKTAQNLNLKGNQDTIIQKIKQISLDLGGAVQQHIKDTNNKKKTSPNSKNGYTSTNWWQKEGKKRVIKKIN